MEHTEREQEAIEIFREAGGVLRTGEALDRGIHRRTLYGLRDSGVLERLAWGLYRLAELPMSAYPGLEIVAKRVPQAVFMLTTALRFHDIGTQHSAYVHIAVPRGTSRPRIEWPPLRVHWLSEPSFSAGIETHTIDGVDFRFYSAAKTVVDCFKFRNKLGLDVALEAMWDGWRRPRKYTMDEIYRYGRICRMNRVMQPYLEAMVA